MRRIWMRWDVILTAKLLCSACKLSDSFIEMAPHAQAPLLCFITAACDSTPHHSGQQSYQPSHNILITKWKIPQMSPCVCLTARSHEKYLKKHNPIIVWLGFIITPNGLLNDWHLFTGWVMRWSLGLFECWIIILLPFMSYRDIIRPARTLKKYRFDTTSVGIKIMKYTLRERQICIGEGQDFGSIPHTAYKKAAHQHTYWKYPGVCLLSLCWFTTPSSG